MVDGKAGNAISKLCTNWVTKNVQVECSAEPFGADWNEEITNE